MNSLEPELRFTKEIAEDFESGRLPTLDFELWAEWEKETQAETEVEAQGATGTPQAKTQMETQGVTGTPQAETQVETQGATGTPHEPSRPQNTTGADKTPVERGDWGEGSHMGEPRRGHLLGP